MVAQKAPILSGCAVLCFCFFNVRMCEQNKGEWGQTLCAWCYLQIVGGGVGSVEIVWCKHPIPKKIKISENEKKTLSCSL